MTRPDLSILVITRNSSRFVVPLLSHLAQELKSLSAEVIVVDNASRDGTAKRIARQFPWVQLMVSKKNLGLAAANNLAANLALGRYMLLLTPEVVPQIGTLRQAIDLLDTQTEVGLMGGEIISTYGKRLPLGRMFPTLRDEFFTMSGLAARFPRHPLLARFDRRWANPDQPAVVDWVPGTFMFIRTQLFEQLGGFDERFFMYYEEVDLGRRIQQLGHGVHYWPEIKAVQVDVSSSEPALIDELPEVPPEGESRFGAQLQYWRMRSGLLYYRKHHGALGALGIFCLEWCWNKLRQIKATAQHKVAKAEYFSDHCAELSQAWRDTRAGAKTQTALQTVQR
ncbi:MAG: glycosyltransferase family 2 protein [Rhodoferax sp.]|nr:glycosyltransferase family 2 protein [Rhodoferax sp.]